MTPARPSGAGAPDILAQATGAGIHRLEVPTPFSVGAVNAYLIEDDPLTLVDTGPNSGTSLDQVERGLAGLGHRVEDLELIAVTHQHMDHLGLVDVLSRRSGAEVAALDALAPWAADWAASMEAEDAYADAVMARYGVPADVRAVLRGMTASFRGWGAPMHVTVPLTDGVTITLRDRELSVHHRPGHSPSDIVLHDRRSGVLFAGDHLLPEIASNPLISRPLGGATDASQRESALLAYAASLQLSRAMEVDMVLPGHGAPFTDHRQLIDQRLETWRRRAARLHGILAEGPRTAYELAQATWGNIAVRQAYLMLSSIIGQADLLLADGLVQEAVRDDGVVVFTAALEGGTPTSEV